MKKAFYILLVIFMAQAAQAQDINKIITKEYVDGLIKSLSDDSMEGRGTFTPGIDRAATFIEKEFKNIGLKPLSGENGYRQSFFKYNVKPELARITIDNQVAEAEKIVVIGNKEENTEFDQNNSGGWTKMDPSKDFMTQYRELSKSNKRQLVLVDPGFESMFNRLKAYLGKGTMVDERELNEGNGAPIVMVLGVDTVENGFKVELKNSIEKMSLFNVAGMIPGKSKEKELIVFSGHYDHLGIIDPVGQDSIANGADDDASGTTAMIALAKYYKALNKNERTLIFVAFTAEEIGGFGAKYFSNKLNPEEVIAMFNIEMIGKDSKFGPNTAFITGFEKSDFGKILQKNLKGTEFAFHPDPYPKQNLFYRSDNATLAALGVPAHTISTVQIEDDKLYHTVKDEYNSLDTQNILETIKGIAKSAVSIVNGTDTPTRIPKLDQ